MTFFVQIALASSKKSCVDEFLEKVEDLHEVIECHHITGSGNFLLKVVTQDLTSFQKLIMDEMSSLTDITNIESMVVLSCVKDSKVMPIPVD
jgi:DNA-binding Lrp family transcriptional regulator